MTIWEMLERCIQNKFMVRFSAWPGGHVSVAIHDNVEQNEQYMYEGTMETVTEEMNEELSEFLDGYGKVVDRVPAKPKVLSLVTPTLPPLPPLPSLK